MKANPGFRIKKLLIDSLPRFARFQLTPPAPAPAGNGYSYVDRSTFLRRGSGVSNFNPIYLPIPFISAAIMTVSIVSIKVDVQWFSCVKNVFAARERERERERESVRAFASRVACPTCPSFRIVLLLPARLLLSFACTRDRSQLPPFFSPPPHPSEDSESVSARASTVISLQ
jgi:hypothetical protein